MLKYIQKQIPNVTSGVGYVIYKICSSDELTQHVKYNFIVDLFEIEQKYLSSYDYKLISMINPLNGTLGNSSITYMLDLYNQTFLFGIN